MLHHRVTKFKSSIVRLNNSPGVVYMHYGNSGIWRVQDLLMRGIPKEFSFKTNSLLALPDALELIKDGVI